MIVHILWHGRALCGQSGLPCDWPEDHKWVGLPDVEEQKPIVKQKNATWCLGCMNEYNRSKQEKVT